MAREFQVGALVSITGQYAVSGYWQRGVPYLAIMQPGEVGTVTETGLTESGWPACMVRKHDGRMIKVLNNYLEPLENI